MAGRRYLGVSLPESIGGETQEVRECGARSQDQPASVRGGAVLAAIGTVMVTGNEPLEVIRDTGRGSPLPDRFSMLMVVSLDRFLRVLSRRPNRAVLVYRRANICLYRARCRRHLEAIDAPAPGGSLPHRCLRALNNFHSNTHLATRSDQGLCFQHIIRQSRIRNASHRLLIIDRERKLTGTAMIDDTTREGPHHR